MNVLFLSHTADGGAFRVGSHHLSRAFADMGDTVTHVSTPATAAHLTRPHDREARRRIRLALHRRPRSLGGVRHVVPATAVPLGRSSWSDRLVARTLARTAPDGGWDVVLVDQPLFASVVGGLAARCIVYRPTDEHARGRMRRAEEQVLSLASGVVATSRTVLESLPAHRPMSSIVIPNGVELSHFRASPSRGVGKGIVYVGAIDHRFDWGTVRALAVAFPAVPLTLIGPCPSPPADLPSNVVLVGEVAYESLPPYLFSAHIGILPFNDHPGNSGRSPMKFYEYLAAGLYVAGSATPALTDRGDLPGVRLFHGSDDAVATVGALLLEPGVNRSGVSVAEEYDWGSRARQLREFLLDVAPVLRRV